ncbi:hypothetical protein [Pseudoalteromonas sp. ESRF-bin5]|uniref:hypothetical protein n=1 Tax=Pseudoalteromonas sp. ESRF-bin5 TaxID=2014532 RepID=UPI00257C2144|nr:hypothetical protein [Pseudoalteromonas sp. ESRF-bin5]
MTYVVFFALLLLITLLATYLKIESNRRKAIEAQKKQFNERVSQVGARLKSKLNELVEAKILRPKYSPRIQAIVSNFFVVQKHTDENLQTLEDVSDLLINTLSNELTKANQTGNGQSLEENIQYFVSELPQQGISYNKTFYSEALPNLIELIKTNDLLQPLDNEENEYIPENQDPNNQLNQHVNIA